MTLYWIFGLTLALICCLTAQPVKRDADDGLLTCLEDFKTAVDKAACLKDEPKYHTPTNNKFLGSALNCSLEQLELLHADCQHAAKDVYDDLKTELKDRLDSLKSSVSDPSFSCKNLPKKNYTDFLKGIEELLQHINADRNSEDK